MKTLTFSIRRSFTVGGLFAILFAAGLNSSRAQDTLVKTDLTWVYSNDEEAGWQQLNFDDSGWEPAVDLTYMCGPGAIGGDHYGNISLLPYTAYLRKEFIVGTIPGPLLMSGGADDDLDIYINGSLAASDKDHLAGPTITLDVTSFIIPNATNIIAVKHTDWYCCGYCMGLSIIAETSPACTFPTNLSAINITSSSAKLKWNGINNAIFYKVSFKKTGTSEWKTIKTINNSKTLHELEANTEYTWKVKSLCSLQPTVASDWSEKLFFTTAPLRLANESDASSIAVYPNPFISSATISFDLTAASPVMIELKDVNGRTISVIAEENFPAGNHEINFDRGALAAGIYFLELKTDEGVVMKKLVVE